MPVDQADTDIEAVCLGAILVDGADGKNDALDAIQAQTDLTGADFYRNAHRTVYETAVDMRARQVRVDVFTLIAELRKRGKLDEVGGPEALHSLANLSANANLFNVISYARQVIDLAIERKRSSLPQDMGIAYAKGDISKGDTLRRELDSVNERKSGIRSYDVPGVMLSEVERKPIHWRWTGRLARGKITLMDGEPGQGKGMITLDVAARLTTGRALHGDSEANPPCNVLLMTPEDDPADTIRPRLEAMGADLSRIRFLTTVPDRDAKTGRAYDRFVTIPRDVAEIEKILVHDKANVLIVDPIMASLDATVKTGIDSEVRAALMPLKQMAERLGVSVMLVRHLNKNEAGKAINRGGGSIAFAGLARLTFLVAQDPDDESARILAPVKSNIGRGAPALRFHITQYGPGAQDIRLEWASATSSYSAHELLSARKSDQRREVVRILQAHAPDAMTPREIAAALGLTPSEDYSSVRMLLSRMYKQGEIDSPSVGCYRSKNTSTDIPITDHQNISLSVEGVTGVTGVTPVTPVTPVTASRYETVTGVTGVTEGVTPLLHPSNPGIERAGADAVTGVTGVTGGLRLLPVLNPDPCAHPRIYRSGATLRCDLCDAILEDQEAAP